MTLSQLSTPLTKDQAYALVDAVMARDDLAITASAHEDADTGEWVFEATCDSEPDLDAFNALARDTLGGEVSFAVEAIDPAVNWVAKSLEGLKSVIAGGFFVYGSHEDAVPTSGVTPIRIDAAQAFGTGHHETTTGCLEAIDRALKRRRYSQMIDVGTGTGVLAIALAKRTHLPVLATDIDPIAVTTTVENARDNGVGNYVIALEATGLDHRQIATGAPYDMVVANILAGPLIALAPEIVQHLAPQATVVLSGLLVAQGPGVTAAYEAEGMKLVRQGEQEGWLTLTLER